jgi:hypothetical protein
MPAYTNAIIVTMTNVYTLKAVAKKEGITYAHLRSLIPKIVASGSMSWRGWRFFGPGARYWLAYREDEEIIFHDVPEDPDKKPSVDDTTDNTSEEPAT